MNTVLRWVVFPNLWISFAAFELASAFGANLNYTALVFTGTLTVYSLNMLSGIEDLKAARSIAPRHEWWIENHQVMRWVTLVSGLLSAVLFVLLDLKTQFLLAAPAMVAMVYVLPLFWWKGRWVKLREIGLAKVFHIAGVWGWVTAFIPRIMGGESCCIASMNGLSVALFIFALCIPFDVRDMPTDSKKGVITLPLVLGVNRALKLALGVLGLSLFMLVFFMGSTMPALGALFTCYVIAATLVAKTNSDRNEAWFGLWVDGTIVLLAVALKVVNAFS